MFAIYPGFEDLSLRVEVEWRGRTRMVVARLEQWPFSHHATLVCAFADDLNDGEWIVMKGSTAYRLDRPDKLRHETNLYCVNTRLPIYQWKDDGRARMQEMVRRGFEGRRNSVARVLRLDELPQEPRLALWALERCFWINGEGHWKWAEFEQPAASFTFSESQARQTLLSQWHQLDSPARFAWEWTKLDDEQRKQHLGFIGANQELERIMSLVLAARNHDWKADDFLMWQFDVNSETGQFYSSFANAAQRNYPHPNMDLSLWENLFLTRYASNWQSELVVQHKCIQQYLASKFYEFGYAIRNQPPTAHEQIEAKLALREWLRDKATPQQIERLLAD